MLKKIDRRTRKRSTGRLWIPLGIILMLCGLVLQPASAQSKVSNQNIADSQSFSNAVSILVGPEIIIASTGQASFNAPLVAFTGSVEVVAGGSMVVTPMAMTGTDTEDELSIIPSGLVLNQNYPNPFSGATNIQYALAKAEHVEIIVFNLLGQRVATLQSVNQQAGEHTVSWNGQLDGGDRAPSGIYMYKMTAGDKVLSRQMILLH